MVVQGIQGLVSLHDVYLHFLCDRRIGYLRVILAGEEQLGIGCILDFEGSATDGERSDLRLKFVQVHVKGDLEELTRQDDGERAERLLEDAGLLRVLSAVAHASITMVHDRVGGDMMHL